MKVPIVVVTRNSLPLTKKTIASALAQDVPVEVLVVDNQSTDGTRAWLLQKPVATIMAPEQWSLSKCWNVALKSLWAAGYDRALVLNNDVEVAPHTVRLLDALGSPFATCVSVDTEEQFRVDAPTVEDLLASQRPHPDYSAYFIRKSVTDRNVWFDEECFPAYVEDSIHHLTMHRAGIPAICVSLPFLHHGASTVKHCSERERRIIQRGAGKNREMFRKRYGCLPGGPGYSELFGHSEAPDHAMG